MPSALLLSCHRRMSALKWVVAGVVLAGANLSAASPCPVRQPGQSYPWMITKQMAGDEWANLLIDLDAKGSPTDCRVGDHSFRPETGFWMCRAILAQGAFQPIMKDGVAVKGTITRRMIMAGRPRQRADEAALKQFFKDHPEERPKCYPE